jgi:hypothetical protein
MQYRIFQMKFRMQAMLACIFIMLFACGRDDSTDIKRSLPVLLNNTGIHFTKRPQPVWNAKYVAGDPTVIRINGEYWMYYTSVDDVDFNKINIAAARSSDGISWYYPDWTQPSSSGSHEHVALDVNPAGWDKFLETSEVIQVGDDLWMYYAGYAAEAGAGQTVANGEIGLARSADYMTFTRDPAVPVLVSGPVDKPDYNALYSPAIVEDGGTYYMLYTGWCIDGCSTGNLFIGILGASSTDGVTWTKRDQPVISGADTPLAWIRTIIEVDLVKAPDGLFYLFFTGEKGIGVARASHPFGPYEIYPRPVLVKTYGWEKYRVIAPSVIIENGKARMWYMGVAWSDFQDFSIGYAETEFPFTWE